MFPTPYTVQRVRRVKVGLNALKQPIYSESTASIPVYSWQPVSQEERYSAERAGRTVSDLKLCSPTGDFKSSDAVIIEGVTYEVDGEVWNRNTGPFGFKPGYTINLRRVTDA